MRPTLWKLAPYFVGLVVIGAVVYTILQPAHFLGDGIAQIRKMVNPPLLPLYDSVVASYEQYRDNAGRWSGVYFSCIFGAALLSAAAGVILKLDSLSKQETLRKDVAAGCAAAAALLITLSTTGNFEAKWRANRLAASGMQSVIYELAKPGVDRGKILDEVAEIHRRQNESVASGQVVPPPTRLQADSVKPAIPKP